MTRDRCAICGQRAGDRRCAALDRELCSSCCGSHRGRFVRCPEDCVHGRLAEERMRERRAKELERAWAGWYRDLSGTGDEAVWSHIEILGEALAFFLRKGLATDAEVEAALRHLDQTLSPVMLVATSPPPLGRVLVDEGFLPYIREGKMDRDKLRRAAHALAAWLGSYRSPEDPLKFVRGVLGLFPPRAEERQGVIVRPQGLA